MAELEPGDTFAGCRIEAVAGRGGMGVVYRARELSLGRPVALKLLAPGRAEDRAFRERFQRESRMAAAIDHPNVVPVYAAGEEHGSLYLVMRYVPGTDLHALLRDHGALAPERAAEIVGQIAAGLDAAHAAGLVHRDVKPANVLLAGDHAYLSDFGLTRLVEADTHLTDSGEWIGTVEYCSPEQLRGDDTDARADVYSLGCVLFAALTGGPPFAQGTVPATLLAQLNDPPPRPSRRGAPWEFDHVVLRALAKDPRARYPSAGDLGRAALAAARGEPVTESERSVAVGPAAGEPATAVLAPEPEPGHAPFMPSADSLWAEAGSGTALPDRLERTAATRFDPAAHDDRTAATAHVPPAPRTARAAGPPLDPGPPPPKVIRTPRRRAHILGALAIFAALVALGLVASQLFGAPDGGAFATGPLTEDEVRSAAEAFGDAYAAEDPAALRRSLTRDVVRVLPGGRVDGREQVVDQYERQFDGKVESYSLDDLEVEGGRAGRATGNYRVDRTEGGPYEGRITFGVVRDRGEPRIQLIAATPSS